MLEILETEFHSLTILQQLSLMYLLALYIFGINRTMAGFEYSCPKTLACNIAHEVTISLYILTIFSP